VAADTFIATVLGNNRGLDPNDIQFPSASSFNVEGIPGAILFIFAVWSGPSVQAFQSLTSVLASRSDLAVPILVLNTDDIPEGVLHKLKIVPAGAGETFWIKHGRILHTVRYFKQTSPREIIEFTQSLVTR
jgi:hypothetical protein